jgi:hypothetical protein
MDVPTSVTNPAGRCFVSYRRSRLSEVERLIRSLRERGIPTWQDVKDLDETHTDSELRRVLKDSDTANAVLWITPDVADSDIIRRVEAPLIMSRADSEDDPFFVVPVAAGGAGYGDAAEAVGEDLSLATLEEWNIRKVANDPAREADVRVISQRVLSRRLRAVVDGMDADDPITLGLFARKGPAADNNFALAMDWTGRITNRHASETIWKRHLLPAVADVVDSVEQFSGGKQVIASGLPTISAAFALGRGFMAPRGIESTWLQFSPASGEVGWSLREAREDIELVVRCRDKDAGADDLAVLVSVSAPVEHAWAASKEDLPSFRALVDVRLNGHGNAVLNAGQALDIAHQTIDAVRQARNEFRPKGSVHLFMAVPVGISFLLGQLSNTLGPIRLYEHDETDAVGRYVAGPQLTE